MTAHREKAYTDIFGNIDLPISENLSDNSLVLPLFVPMSDNDINHIIHTVQGILS